ncbi:MAG: STAS/SEC14 domain-containing protein [Cyclobacteriaceae bacterium]
MIRLMKDLPESILGVFATEKITGEDYETILIPALEEKLKANAKIRMIYHIDGDFTGFEFSALWDDAKFGMKHLSEFERVALVSDHEMINSIVRFFSYMIKSEIKIFKDRELLEAKEWIIET